jgi:glutathione synthase/RimK-type ligase-like ATP-grasp enzyme
MMKMIIILTNRDDITVDYIVRELQKQKLEYYRLNTEDIPHNIEIDFHTTKNAYALYDKKKNMKIELNKIDSVYFRRAKISNLDYIDNITDQERSYLKSELAFVLEGIYKLLSNTYWLNNIYDIREAENKIFQLQIAREIGFTIPNSLISNNFQSVRDEVVECCDDCIIKPIKSGSIKDGSMHDIIFTSKVSTAVLGNKDSIRSFPVFVQKNIHKKFDLRCIVVGEKVFCAQIYSQSNEEANVDWRRSRIPLRHEKHILPQDVIEKCILITKRLNLNYSAIDLILDDNDNYIFLECNPNGQWAWIENRLGYPISREIVYLLKNGRKNENSKNM